MTVLMNSFINREFCPVAHYIMTFGWESILEVMCAFPAPLVSPNRTAKIMFSTSFQNNTLPSPTV